jgi:GAF domain-containing protein
MLILLWVINMFEKTNYVGTTEEKYAQLFGQLEALTLGEVNVIANLANASALLNCFLSDINWVGFYLVENNELVLGPFQGLPACIRIPLGKGVCGVAAKTKQTQLVPNVHEFAGHIACDANSKSEIVIPMIVDKELFGVLDIDAPIYNRFTVEDKRYLEQFVNILCKQING